MGKPKNKTACPITELAQKIAIERERQFIRESRLNNRIKKTQGFFKYFGIKPQPKRNGK